MPRVLPREPKKDDIKLPPAAIGMFPASDAMQEISKAAVEEALRKQSEMGLLVVDDFDDIQDEETGLPVGLPKLVNGEPVVYCRLDYNTFSEHPWVTTGMGDRAMVVAVTRDNPAFEHLPAVAFQNGILRHKDTVVCYMAARTAQANKRRNKRRLNEHWERMTRGARAVVDGANRLSPTETVSGKAEFRTKVALPNEDRVSPQGVVYGDHSELTFAKP